jgi:hypothetical protein
LAASGIGGVPGVRPKIDLEAAFRAGDDALQPARVFGFGAIIEALCEGAPFARLMRRPQLERREGGLDPARQQTPSRARAFDHMEQPPPFRGRGPPTGRTTEEQQAPKSSIDGWKRLIRKPASRASEAAGSSIALVSVNSRIIRAESRPSSPRRSESRCARRMSRGFRAEILTDVVNSGAVRDPRLAAETESDHSCVRAVGWWFGSSP